jgi:hypothetical protein
MSPNVEDRNSSAPEKALGILAWRGLSKRGRVSDPKQRFERLTN